MKKQQIILLIIISSLISAIVSPSVGSGMEEGFPYFPSSSLPQQTVGGGASEEEDIDTFDVHPGSGRWNITNENSFSDIIENSLYVVNDTGDGSSDAIGLKRGLNSFDDKIEVRFKFDTNLSETANIDFFRLGLYGDSEVSAGYPDCAVFLRVESLKMSNESSTTILQYYDDDYNPVTKVLTGSEKLYAGYWYTLRIDFDLLKSEFRLRCYFENNSKVFDYYWYEVSSTRPNIFDSNVLSAYMLFRSYTNAKYVEYQVDYIEAPFKSREWAQIDTPADSDWLEDNWDFARVQDDITDTSEWQIAVPYLDACSGLFGFQWDNDTLGFNDGCMVYSAVTFCAVDADDGDLHDIFYFQLIQFRMDVVGTNWGTQITIIENGTTMVQWNTQNTNFPVDEHPAISFSFANSEDRSKSTLRTRYWVDRFTEDEYHDYVFSIDIAGVADDPSQEFVIQVGYSVSSLTTNTFWTGYLEGFGFIEKDIFSDFVNSIVEPLGNFLFDLFVGIFRFLADIFKFVGEGISASINQIQGWLTTLGTTITTAVNQIQGWLTTLGTTITTAINQIETWLNTIATTITGAIADIETWLNSIATTISDAIADIAADIWDSFSAAAGTFADALITALGTLISDVATLLVDVIEVLLPLLLALAEYIWGVIAAVVFWVWDELGLPDLLAIVEVLLTGFIQLINGIPTFITDMAAVIQALFTLIPVIGLIIFFGFPLAQRDIGGYFEAMLSYMAFDITFEVQVFGNGIYIPAVAAWLVISLATVLSGTTYAGFF